MDPLPEIRDYFRVPYEPSPPEPSEYEYKVWRIRNPKLAGIIDRELAGIASQNRGLGPDQADSVEVDAAIRHIKFVCYFVNYAGAVYRKTFPYSRGQTLYTFEPQEVGWLVYCAIENEISGQIVADFPGLLGVIHRLKPGDRQFL